MCKFHLNPRSPSDMAFVRQSLGITQREIGEVMLLTRRHIGEIENGCTRPTGASTILYGIVLDEICKERGTTFEDVLRSKFA